VDEKEGPSECPRVAFDLVNTLTGQVIAGSCRATFCEVCGPRQAWWKSRIISDGGASGPPTRYLVLTQAPPDWQAVRQKMRDLRRWALNRGHEWEHAWTLEVGAKTGMRHINVLQKGSYVNGPALRERWGAFVKVKKIREPEGVSSYVLKEAGKVAGYSLKEAKDGGEQLHRFLDNNGGRLVHLSAGYLGGERQDQVRARLLSKEGVGQWVVRAK
jgi:hypothetical protein